MFVDFFINRPIFAVVCSVVIILAGAVCIPSLPIAQYPKIAPPQVTVTATYIGASAEVVESAVTTPLEQVINGVEGMRYITSNSTNSGVSTITTTFNLDRDIDIAAVDVQNRVSTALGRLPQEVNTTGVAITKNPSAILMAIGFYCKNNEYDNTFISNYADRFIKDALKRVKGVGDVTIVGERKYAMRLWVDPNRLAARHLTATDVVNALREQNIQVAAGQIGLPPSAADQDYQFSVRAMGRLKTPGEFESVILKAGPTGTMVRLKDVGHAELGAEDYSGFMRFNGLTGVGILVYQLPNANALETEQLVTNEMEHLKQAFPPGLMYRTAFDPTTVVRQSINEVIVTLVIAILLVVAVIFIFLQDWRSTLIPAMTIPVSLIGTFAFLKVFNFSINTLTLFGLTLATGLVVDDAIVVIENIARFVQEKHLPPKQAASEGMHEVFGAVLATSLVLIAVFVPVAFFPGTTGQLYKQFALTIAFSITLSAFNAFTLTPALTALFLSEEAHDEEKQSRFFRVVNKGINGLRNGYAKTMPKAASQFRPLMLVVFVLLLGLTLFMFQRVPLGFLPQDDQGYFIITLQAPEGGSVNNTAKIMDQVASVLDPRKIPEIAGSFAVGGFSFTGAAANKGSIFPALTDIEKRTGKGQTAGDIINRVREPLSKISGASVIPFAPPAIQGVGSFGGFQFELLDQANLGLDTLAKTTLAFMGKGNTNPALRGVYSAFTANSPQLLVDVDRERAKALGVTLSDIFSTLQVYLGSQYINDFDYLNRIYRVYVQADSPFRSNPADISQFYVRSTTGAMIPLSNLLKVTPHTAPQVISHYNLFRSTEINGTNAPGYSSGQAMDAMAKMADNTDTKNSIMPKGMGYDWSGISLEQRESGSQTIFIFGLGLAFVFLVLAAQYESFTDPLVILLAVPLAILGALLAQSLRGLENDVYCQVGLVMLIGLASKNAILIVEFANQLRRQGANIYDAAVEAAETRFRPIVMTSLAFILGIMPLVFATGAGAESRHSLGTAVFGGMILSTILSLYLVPVLYIVVENSRERVVEWKQRGFRRHKN